MTNKEINIHNYEEFLVDYMDGSLGEQEMLMVEAFLIAHPDIREEFEAAAGVGLEAGPAKFPHKDSLKREVESLSEIDEILIAYVEGDLERPVKAKVNELIRTDDKIADQLKLYQLTRLHPSTDVKYPAKKEIKQPVPLYGQNSLVNKWVLRIAAALILLIGSALVIRTLVQDAGQPAAEIAESAADKRSDIVKSMPGNARDVLADENIVEQPEESITESSIEQQENTAQVADKTVSNNNKQKGTSNTDGPSAGDESPSSQELDRPRIDQIPVLEDHQLALVEYNAFPETDPELQTIEQEEEYMGFFQGLRTLTKKEVAREIASNEQGQEPLEDDSYKKVKLLDIVGLGLRKASDDKIQLTKQSSGDNVTAYGLSIGKFKIEK